jgi:hypothetical protein
LSPATGYSDTARTSRWVWGLVLVLHLGAAVVGFASDPLLLPVAVAGAVLWVFLWIVVARAAFVSFMLTVWFCWWSTFIYAYMNLAYVRLTNFPVGGAHELTAWMTALMTGCTAFGAASAHALIGRDAFPKRATPLALRWQPVAVAGLFFVLVVAGAISSGWLNARYESHEFDPTGAWYLVGGLGVSGYMVFFFLGTRIGSTLRSPASLGVLATVGFLALAQSLGGGRGASVFMVILMLGGATWRGELPRKQMLGLVASLLFVGVGFAMVVGNVRGRAGFGHGSVGDRIALLQQGAREISSEDDSDDSMAQLINRLFEFPGQDVIDQTFQTQHFAGFEDFDRLKYLFIPLALAPDKLPVSNSNEVLERDFGYHLGELTSVPISLVGDAYRRGGAPWVAAVGFAVGATLRVLTRLTLVTLGPDFALVGLFIYMLATNAHDDSVLGAISILTYHWMKYVLITLAFGVGTRLLIRLSKSRKRGTVERLVDGEVRQ